MADHSYGIPESKGGQAEDARRHAIAAQEFQRSPELVGAEEPGYRADEEDEEEAHWKGRHKEALVDLHT